MKKIRWISGIILLFVGLSACDKNYFETNQGLEGMDLKGTALEPDEPGSAFAYGTHVFTTNPKANPDGLVPLSLTRNRWGWANYLPKTFVQGNEFINTMSTFYLNGYVNGSIVNVGTVLVNYDEQNLIFKIIFHDGYSFPETGTNTPLLTVKLSVPGSNWKIFQYNYVYTNYVYVNKEYTLPLSEIPSPGFTLGNPLYLIIEGYVNSNLVPIFLSSTIGGNNIGYQAINTLAVPSEHSEKTYYDYIDNSSGGMYSVPSAFEIYNDGNFLYFNKLGTGFRTLSLQINGISVYDCYNGSISEITSCKLALFKIPGYDGNGSTVNVLIHSESIAHGGTIYNTGTYIFNLGTPSIIGNKVFPIYIGAALNDPQKGIQVGNATVTYDGNELKVKYDLFDEYLMNEVHVYASDLQPATIAPGQYGFTEMFNEPVGEFETIFNIEDAEDDGIWLILHAVIAL